MRYTAGAVDPQQLGQLYRAHSGAILARIIRLTGGDFSLAEEAVQDAFSAALMQWPVGGVPEYPRAWLARAARNKAIDRLRHKTRFEAPLPEEELAALSGEPADDQLESETLDDQLRLIFTCCHPALAPEAQVALTLRTLCGLTTDEIARAFLVEPSAMAQRLVRAQQKIKLAKIPYIVPERKDLDERLEAVLSVVYLVFNEGYAATTGDTLLRRELCGEALRLGFLLERSLPERPEPWALTALMLLHDSRSAARFDAAGDVVLLEDQDRTRWQREQIEAGLTRIERALRAGLTSTYAIQAAIAALHARAPTARDTDWPQIALLYAELMRRAPTPVVALNHAAAVGMAKGPTEGLALLEHLAQDPAMQNYHLFYAARADLQRRAGQHGAARSDYARALELVRNEPERRFLERRLGAPVVK
jgi:RNA polymerase sigma-70 factor (ECF subfamily)